MKKTLKTSVIIFGSVLAISTYEAMAVSNTQTPVQASEVTVALAQTNSQFLNKAVPHAFELAHENDLYASVMLAQAILESGWGTSALSSEPNNNLFGIKGNYNGQTVVMDTLEDAGGQNYYAIKDGFRKYPSYRESLSDYVGVIKNGPAFDSNYYSGAWKSNTTHYSDATAWLTGRYATDTAYAPKLNNLIATYNLDQYDTPIGATGEVKGVLVDSSQVDDYNAGNEAIVINQDAVANVTPNVTGVNPVTDSSVSSSYTVKAGDGLYSAARALGMTVDEVKAANGLTSNLIHPGQVLIGTKTATDNTAVAQTEAASKPATSQAAKSYTVKAGDGVYTVARALNMSVAEMKAANGLTSDLIHPGQVFYASNTVAATETADNTQEVETATTPELTAKTSYTLKAGDGVYTAANALGITIAELKAANGLTSNLVHPGQTLYSTNQKQVVTTPEVVEVEAVTEAAATEKTTHTVKSGETMWRIANKNGLTVDQVKDYNNLSTSTVYIGQVLNLKPTETVVETAQEATPVVAEDTEKTENNKTYTVKKGDNLYRIAKNNNVELATLKAANNLTTNNILVGQVLVLPA